MQRYALKNDIISIVNAILKMRLTATSFLFFPFILVTWFEYLPGYRWNIWIFWKTKYIWIKYPMDEMFGMI